jgi:hypothetical protein
VSLLATLAVSAALGLPGMQGGPAPWVPEWDNLAARLQADGLPVLGAEAFVVHIHQHLDLYVHGKHEPIPALIGINVQQRYLSPIHTHDFSGLIHVEAPTKRTFTLGQFWDVYGVRFNAQCVGGECGGVKVYVNGTRYLGNARAIVLREHEELAVVVGKPPKRMPKRYAFPQGL